MSLEVLDRHSEALFEFLWCPVCGQEVFTHIPFEGCFARTATPRSNSRNPEKHAATRMPCSPASILPPPGTSTSMRNCAATCLMMGQRARESSAHRAPTRSTGGVQSPVRTGNLWSVESSTTSRNHLRCRTWRRARVRAVNLRPTHVAGPASTRGSLVEVETAPPSKLIRIRVLAVRELVQIDPVRQGL